VQRIQEGYSQFVVLREAVHLLSNCLVASSDWQAVQPENSAERLCALVIHWQVKQKSKSFAKLARHGASQFFLAPFFNYRHLRMLGWRAHLPDFCIQQDLCTVFLISYSSLLMAVGFTGSALATTLFVIWFTARSENFLLTWSVGALLVVR